MFIAQGLIIALLIITAVFKIWGQFFYSASIAFILPVPDLSSIIFLAIFSGTLS
jgi:hypothetical protein